MFNKSKTVLLLVLMLQAVSSFAAVKQNDGPPGVDRYPFYLGFTGGYGSTTWGQLVPPQSKANAAMSLSTPAKVNEGGPVWGVFVGYQLIQNFAVELAYSRYPNADVIFDPYSLFTFDHDDLTHFTTKTEIASASGKFMFLIPKTKVSAFSLVGAAGIHRDDLLTNRWRLTPTFGVGLGYTISPHLVAEIGVNYTGGYGESELDPVQDYIPFLYSGFFRLAIHF